MNDLVTTDARRVFDIIDRLRTEDLGKYVDLPEIVVCGDQSSGKSSALEAISRMSFPIKDTVCTRFATQLMLRWDPIEKTQISIVPSPERPHYEKDELRSFSAKFHESFDLGKVVNNASDAMGVGGDRRFSHDILKIEISGPEQPHLTMIDLPGLFLSASREQSEEDADMVQGLVKSHLERQRSVILAVISAKSDFNTQGVTRLTRQVDPDGQRTLGLITKPDKLDQDSDDEKFYLELARNTNVTLGLGWHVLRNRDFTSRDTGSSERDAKESEFFETTAWASLGGEILGVGNLRPRLSGVLKSHILDQVPSLISEIEKKISDCQKRLSGLGVRRATLEEKKEYLMRVSREFSNIIQKSVDGDYNYPDFFGSPATEQGYSRRLRAGIQNTLSGFANEMNKKGRTLNIIDDDDENASNIEAGSGDEEATQEQPKKISRAKYIQGVTELMRRNRGRELPGTWSPEIIEILFKDQARPWEGIIHQLELSVMKLTRYLVNQILDHVCVQDTAAEVRKAILEPSLYSLRNNLHDKTSDVMRSYLALHPITYNHYLTENVQKAQKQRQKKTFTKTLQKTVQTVDSKHSSTAYINIPAWAEALASGNEPDMEKYASSNATDFMEAYYKVALKTVIDEISHTAVEDALLSKLPDIFSLDAVLALRDEEVERYAQESPAVTRERQDTDEKLRVLKASLEDLYALRQIRDDGARSGGSLCN